MIVTVVEVVDLAIMMIMGFRVTGDDDTDVVVVVEGS